MKFKSELFLQPIIESGFVTDVVVTDNLGLFLRVDKSDEDILNGGPLQIMQQTLSNLKSVDLNSFTSNLSNCLSSLEFKASFAFAGCINLDGKVYLVTRGLGAIYLVRQTGIQKIISGQQNASGRLESEEMLLLGSYDLFSEISEASIIPLLGYSDDEFSDAIAKVYSGFDIGGFAVLGTEANKEIYEEEVEVEEETPQEPIQEVSTTVRSTPSSRRNLITITISVIILIILIWSVVFGYQRRSRQEVIKNLEKIEPEISSKLIDAEEIAPIDLNEAKEIVNQAKKLYEPIEKSALSNNIQGDPAIKSLTANIKKVSDLIESIENKKPEEFYDLVLLGNEVLAKSFVNTDRDTVAVLDAKNKIVYEIESEKKSVTKYSSSELKSTLFGEISKNVLFFVNNNGVFRLPQGGTTKKVIDNDDWGEIVGFSVYNNNIYVVDRTKDEVYKYLVASENTYSGKNSYFKANQSFDLQDFKSFANDGSIYLGYDNTKISKFTSGLKQSFALKTDINFNITKILARTDSENIYLFDKNKGSVLIFDKEGQFQREIISKYLRQSQDITLLSDNKLVFLHNNKLFKVE